LLALFGRNGLLASLAELLNRLLVETQILLAADKDLGNVGAEVVYLRAPLLADVVEGIGRVDGKANQDDVGVGVRKGTETIIVFLASGIPKRELNVLSINLDIGNIVLKDGRNIDLREGTLGENNQQAGLSAGTVTDDDQLPAKLGSHCCGCELKVSGCVLVICFAVKDSQVMKQLANAGCRNVKDNGQREPKKKK